MFEDIIGEIRHIEILYADDIWRLSRIKKLMPGFTFRFLDNPEIHYRADKMPFQHSDGYWGVLGTPLDMED